MERREKKTYYPSASHTGRPSSWGDSRPANPILTPGFPQTAGMVSTPLDQMNSYLEKAIRKKVTPGAVLLVARKGTIVKHQAYGYAARYSDNQFTPLVPPIPMRNNTIFDLASISKIFTAVAVMKLYEQGYFQLDDPVSKYIPEFAENGKQVVTIRQLLTHTSGFCSGIPLYKMGTDRQQRLQIALRYPLENPPGTTYNYSDLNMVTLGVLVERLSGKRLDQFVRQEITEPLQMHDTFYNPPRSLKHRIAATEYQPWTGRSMVWGEVHDENAAALDGVAGHAGVFSTARDLAIFAHMMLMDGKYGSTRILKKETIRLMEKNYTTSFPGDDHGLGWELNQGWYMDALASPDVMGHTGFTGTSLVIHRSHGTITILLTNRVHPIRKTVSNNPLRREMARMTADAIPVRILGTMPVWFSGYGDQLSRSLVASLPLASDERTLSFSTWHRIEPEADRGTIEVSTDGMQWQVLQPGNFTGNSPGWITLSIPIPKEARFIRFHYQTDKSVNGRGWYVKNAVIETRGQVILLYFHGKGWTQRTY
ncbi:serine hydrolase [Thermoactinomyces sp. AMNI-1]|uniref:Serine hydrolase n=2 Tax=Thermoactinomyces mirandus TaxID=2756294 RepID=A0A7W2AQW2_9BACL|nr:serine hydrolase [Thermoactinomyces mirandus]